MDSSKPPLSKTDSKSHGQVRVFATAFGLALLGYLVLRTGATNILQHARQVGWGLLLIFALGGVAHLVKTWAWRLTFQCDLSEVSLARSFALRLISEAASMFGLPGTVLGEALRVSLLGRSVPVANSVSAATLDRGLFVISAAMLSVAGIVFAFVSVSLSKSWRLYSLLFAGGMAVFLGVITVAMVRRWPVISATTRALGRLPGFKKLLNGKGPVIESTERKFLGFFYDNRRDFWASLSLNLVSQGLAVLEVYLLLHFMGVKIALVGALVLEALTKVISIIGAINPGNIGTFEGGNMVITRLFGITSAAGLTLGLCRRARALFWAAVGCLCLIVMSKSTRRAVVDKAEAKALSPMPNEFPAGA